MKSAAIVFAAVPVAPSTRLRTRLAGLDNPFVVAADAGAKTAFDFGLRPDVVVGDLDSIEPATLAGLGDVPIEKYSPDKDATDGQLAVERALQRHPSELVLVGFLGGPRLDHELANLFLLTRVDTSAVLLDEHNEATVLRPGADHVWRPEPGEVVSLIPIVGDVHGVHARGLRWPLKGETLRFGDTRGLSNEPVANEVGVSIASGALLVTRHFPPTTLSPRSSVLSPRGL